MRKILRKLKKLDLFVLALLVIIFGINIVYIVKKDQGDLIRAKIENINETYNDGGLVYQDMEVKSSKTGQEPIKIIQEVPAESNSQYHKGDSVIIKKVGVSYKVVGFDMTRQIIIALAVLLLMLVISVGLDDFKEMLPILLIFPFIISGLFLEMFDQIGAVFTIIAVLTAITALTAYAVSRQKIIALATTSASLFTFLSVFSASAVFFRIFHISLLMENFNSLDNPLEFNRFRELYILGIITVIFGVTVNSTIATSKRAMGLIKRPYPRRDLIRKIIFESQKDIARRINSIFFLLLGISLIELLDSYKAREDFWNQIVIVEGLVYFIISGLSVILSVFFSASFVTLFIKASNKETTISR